MTYRILSWLLILFACFYGIGSYPLLDNNEGLYASIARDMLLNKQFVIPHLLGVPYLEKPPMLYWLMAASISLFGTHEWALRLVPAMAYFLTAVALKRFITRTTGNEKAGFTAAIILATSLPMQVFGREILCDMLLTCFFTAALFAFYTWHEEQKKNHLLAFYAFLALAVLTKGFIAVILAGGIIVTFYLWERKAFRDYIKILSPLGMLVFFVIAAPWHIAASLQEEGFAWFYFINEHVLRFVDRREPHDYHTGSWWYYVPRILAYLTPWTLFLLIFLRQSRLLAPPRPSAERFLWSWFFVCLVFFSSAGSKANYYMIIAMPPVVALITLHLQSAIDSGGRLARSFATGAFTLLLAIFWLTQYFCGEYYSYLHAICQNIPQTAIIGAAIYSVLAIVACWRIPQHWLAPLLGSHAVLLMPLLIAGASNDGDLISQKSTVQLLQSTSSPQIAIYQDFEDISALAFYLEKPPVIVDSQSNDLLYGQKRNANPSRFLSLSEWATRKPYVPMVLLENKLYGLIFALHDLNIDLKHMCIGQRIGRVILVSMCDGH